MKVTLELLNKYNANKSCVDYLVENDLDGADLMDFIDRAPLDFLYFLREYLKFNEEETEAFNKTLELKNSTNVWYSRDVESSSNINLSVDIVNSNMIYNCEKVEDSSFISYGYMIKNSNNVYNGRNVYDSDSVIEGNNINASEQVAYCSDISWSENVFRCANLSDCGFSYQSKNLKDCWFCGFVKDSSNCLFCDEIEGKEYYIFNEKVDPQTYAEIMEELRERLLGESARMIEINDEAYSAGERLHFSTRYDSVFYGLSKEFYGWVGTLPNYTDDKFVSLFFRDVPKI